MLAAFAPFPSPPTHQPGPIDPHWTPAPAARAGCHQKMAAAPTSPPAPGKGHSRCWSTCQRHTRTQAPAPAPAAAAWLAPRTTRTRAPWSAQNWPGASAAFSAERPGRDLRGEGGARITSAGACHIAKARAGRFASPTSLQTLPHPLPPTSLPAPCAPPATALPAATLTCCPGGGGPAPGPAGWAAGSRPGRQADDS